MTSWTRQSFDNLPGPIFNLYYFSLDVLLNFIIKDLAWLFSISLKWPNTFPFDWIFGKFIFIPAWLFFDKNKSGLETFFEDKCFFEIEKVGP